MWKRDEKAQPTALTGTLMRGHDERTERRAESQGVDERDGDGRSHRQTELRVERSRGPADEGSRE